MEGWVLVYNDLTAIQQSRYINDDHVLNPKLSLNWTDPFEVFCVGPIKSAPDGKPVKDKLLQWNLPSGLKQCVPSAAFLSRGVSLV